MKKKLKSSGNCWELYFSKQLLKLLGYNPTDTKVLLTFKNNILIIEPLNEKNMNKYQHNMIRGFQKSGSSHSIYFSNLIIDALEIIPYKDYLDIHIDGDRLEIKKYSK